MDKIRSIMFSYGKDDLRKFYYFIISNLNWSRYVEQVRFLAAFIPRSANVLELGCGCGQTTAMLADIRPDLKIVGTDIEKARTWDYFREYGCEFLECDARNIPFPDNTFDVIVSFGVIEHVGRYDGFLKENHRCLKSNSYNIIFNLPNRYSFPEFACRVLKVSCHEKRFSMSDISKIVLNAGFVLVDSRKEHLIPAQIDRLHPLLGSIFNRIYKELLILDKILCVTPLSFFCQDIRLILYK